jgi:hypothetical protein
LEELKRVHLEEIAEHTFQIYDWDDSEGWLDRLIEKFSPIVKEYYTNFSDLEAELNKLLDDDLGFTSQNIESCLKECLEVCIPDPDNDPKPEQFKTYRSDFPEILASICLQELFNTLIPVNGIKARERTNLPGRGIDIIGYEIKDDICHLIICEIKGSCSSSNPPSCVNGKSDSIANQLLSCVTDRKKTLNRLTALFSKCDPNHKPQIGKLLFLWQREMHDKMKVILCPFLVREKSKYKDKDYTFMKDQLDNYSPGIIRFIIICINGDLARISKKLYEFAPLLEVYHDD